jgi:hypothetical protein
MKKTQPEDSEQQGGWPSKKVMAGRSGKVFSLDFLFIEQAHPAERGMHTSNGSRWLNWSKAKRPLMLGVRFLVVVLDRKIMQT